MLNAALGCWVQRDPIGYAGMLNLLEYCTSNPVAATDYDGQIDVGRALKCGAFATAAGASFAWCLAAIAAAGASGGVLAPVVVCKCLITLNLILAMITACFPCEDWVHGVHSVVILASAVVCPIILL